MGTDLDLGPRLDERPQGRMRSTSSPQSPQQVPKKTGGSRGREALPHDRQNLNATQKKIG